MITILSKKNKAYIDLSPVLPGEEIDIVFQNSIPLDTISKSRIFLLVFEISFLIWLSVGSMKLVTVIFF